LAAATRILKLKAWKELADINMQALLFAVLYILVATQSFSLEKILGGLLLLLSLAAYLCFGVLVNDYCDMPIDLKAGKRSEMHEVPKHALTVLIVALFLGGFTFVSLQAKNPVFAMVFALTYFFATFYSAYPLRFKQRGAIGIMVDMLIEKTLPLTLVLIFFSYFSFDSFLIVLYFSIMQLKLILDHQIFDYDTDLSSGVNTFVVRLGLEKSEAIVTWFLRPAFVLTFVLLCVFLVINVPYFLIASVILLVGYLALQAMVLKNLLNRVNIRTEMGLWISRIPFYDGYITGSMGFLLLFILFSAMLAYFPFVVLLPLTIISQLYVIRGHYLRIFNNFFRLFSQKIRKPTK